MCILIIEYIYTSVLTKEANYFYQLFSRDRVFRLTCASCQYRENTHRFRLKNPLKIFSADNNGISYTFSNEDKGQQYATRATYARFRYSALHLFRYRSSDKVSLYVAALFSSQAVYAFLAIPH